MTKTLCTKLSLIVLGALLFPLPAASSAQSLGEVARQYRKEMEARQKKGEVPARVFTNDDVARMPPVETLRSSPQPTSAPSSNPPAPSQPPGTTGGETPAVPSAKQAGEAGKDIRSKEYWQARFKAARTALEYAEEEQNVVENELQLLQVQQARELDPDRSRELNGRIDTTAIELKARRAASDKARQAMEKLEKEFKKSGAPQDWVPHQGSSGKTDAGSANPSGPGAEPPPLR